jgi:hypothetical protein
MLHMQSLKAIQNGLFWQNKEVGIACTIVAPVPTSAAAIQAESVSAAAQTDLVLTVAVAAQIGTVPAAAFVSVVPGSKRALIESDILDNVDMQNDGKTKKARNR